MKWKCIIKFFILILIILIVLCLLLFIIRLFSSRHLDDLHPGIPCDEDLIKKADYLAVIPKFNNENISNNRDWCNYIKSFNKTLVMHGVYHTYNEFDTLRNSDYIREGREIFLDCFNFSPTEFKPPQLALSRENMKILEEGFNFKVYTGFSMIFHKVYHCNDSGVPRNWFADWL